ncbi:hypothetical protein AUR04nite_00340 [Glutamicibacter uratoxydans]|uniref:Uncharacterized protein n=1 Tax=Glutamicibacter uratoxydans TaxID=43667 RepID=A0A4Y4DH00_GLUUR|nr:hypothetical protein [Glutamicibacter uratoxydans]GED04502.1 hypothetical protein AUR04nite_00340 [Glutamicibacter uratoxydans]
MATAEVIERASLIDHVLLKAKTIPEARKRLREIVKPIPPEPGFMGWHAATELDKGAFEHLLGEPFPADVKGDESAYIRSMLVRRYVKNGQL